MTDIQDRKTETQTASLFSMRNFLRLDGGCALKRDLAAGGAHKALDRTAEHGIGVDIGLCPFKILTAEIGRAEAHEHRFVHGVIRRESARKVGARAAV